ncbi:MAG: hypothetical protein LBN36_01365, partial [Clostridiales Family XIII bacterium]|nr:hypothetical protein [Clostridiales Family XIII bacterium]
PSVQFEANGFNRVISNRSLNADGGALLDESKPRGDIISALEDVVTSAMENDYITSEGVTVTIASKNPEIFSVLDDLIQETLSFTKLRIIAITPEEADEALKLGVLPHRYILAKQAAAADADLSFEEALHLKNSFLELLINGEADWPLPGMENIP